MKTIFATLVMAVVMSFTTMAQTPIFSAPFTPPGYAPYSGITFNAVAGATSMDLTFSNLPFSNVTYMAINVMHEYWGATDTVGQCPQMYSCVYDPANGDHYGCVTSVWDVPVINTTQTAGVISKISVPYNTMWVTGGAVWTDGKPQRFAMVVAGFSGYSYQYCKFIFYCTPPLAPYTPCVSSTTTTTTTPTTAPTKKKGAR